MTTVRPGLPALLALLRAGADVNVFFCSESQGSVFFCVQVQFVSFSFKMWLFSYFMVLDFQTRNSL